MLCSNTRGGDSFAAEQRRSSLCVDLNGLEADGKKVSRAWEPRDGWWWMVDETAMKIMKMKNLRKQFADDKIVMASVLSRASRCFTVKREPAAMPFGRDGGSYERSHLLPNCLCENRWFCQQNAFFVCYL